MPTFTSDYIYLLWNCYLSLLWCTSSSYTTFSIFMHTLYIHLFKQFLWKQTGESWHKKCNQKNLWLLSYEFKPYTFNVSSFYWYIAIYSCNFILYFIFGMHFFSFAFLLSNCPMARVNFILLFLKVTYSIQFFSDRINLLKFVIIFSLFCHQCLKLQCI